MLNQWWSYNLNEEETHSEKVSDTRQRFSQRFSTFPSRKIHGRNKGNSRVCTPSHELMGLENPTHCWCCMKTETTTHEQNGFSTWAHSNKAFSNSQDFLTIWARWWKRDGARTDWNNQMFSLSVGKTLLEGCTFLLGKFKNSFHAIWIGGKLTRQPLISSAFSMAVSFQLHHNFVPCSF